MDAALVWTAVGSGAAVAGVVVAAVTTVTQARSKRKVRAKVTAELGIGQLDRTGNLFVRSASGDDTVIALPEREESEVPAEEQPDKEVPNELFGPVNVIRIYNQGYTDVTVSHCQYKSDLGGVGFKFEPQPGASTRGDLLPKRLASGEEAILIHNLKSMRVFLNHVLQDHEMHCAIFDIVLILGSGEEITLPTSMHAQADMSEQELDSSAFKLTRQELPEHPEFAGLTLFPRQRRR